MKSHDFDFFMVFVLLLLCYLVHTTTAKSGFDAVHRRVLHEPLITTAPPAGPNSPPPPVISVFPSTDQPFFNEVPKGSNSDQSSMPPQQQPQVPNKSIPVPIQANKPPTKRVAVAVSVGIVTLGMLSALAFFLYKHRVRHSGDARKLVGGISQRVLEESRMPPPSSNFLYIGTVEPPVNRRSFMEENGEILANGSPYHKLNSIKRSDRYRPSPELQPLPPLSRELNRIPSPATTYSSDDDMFYTPQCSAGGAFTPVTSHNYPANNNSPSNCNAPHSKRASPKSRLLVSSPDMKCTIIPPIKKPPPPPLPPPPVPLRSPLKEKITTKPTSSLEQLDSDETEWGRPKLKALHWDKVRATSDRATVWDQLNSSNFQLNEDMMETLFGCNSTIAVRKESRRKMVLPPVEHETRVLDPKKSQNIAILLRALNVTRDEVFDALLDGNPEHIGVELLETLVKMAPTKEEEIKLQRYSGDISKLGSAERFLKAILDIPFAFKRVEAMLYRENFDTEVNYLRKSYQTLKVASEELKNSRLFLKLLEAVLRAGNRMNVGTNRGDARAFKLDTLLKLVDVKATDGKTTLLHFVVHEITRSESAVSEATDENLQNKIKTDDFKKQNLQVVAGLSRDLGNVKKAAGMDSDVLSGYLSKLETGLEKIRLTLQYDKSNMQGRFFDSMKTFTREADKEIIQLKSDERKALCLVKEATEYFHGDSAKEEAHPLRVFMIVRDFLSVLDHVCKEVGWIQDRVLVGSARSFQISSNASLPVLNRYNFRQHEESPSP